MRHAIFALNPTNIGSFAKIKGFLSNQSSSKGFHEAFDGHEHSPWLQSIILCGHFLSVGRTLYTTREEKLTSLDSTMMIAFTKMARVRRHTRSYDLLVPSRLQPNWPNPNSKQK